MGADGLSNFDFIRYRHHNEAVFLYAFDLLQLGVDDLRRDPLEAQSPPCSPSFRSENVLMRIRLRFTSRLGDNIKSVRAVLGQASTAAAICLSWEAPQQLSSTGQ